MMAILCVRTSDNTWITRESTSQIVLFELNKGENAKLYNELTNDNTSSHNFKQLFLFNFRISYERLCSETSHHFKDLRAIVNFKFLLWNCVDIVSFPNLYTKLL